MNMETQYYDKELREPMVVMQTENRSHRKWKEK